MVFLLLVRVTSATYSVLGKLMPLHRGSVDERWPAFALILFGRQPDSLSKRRRNGVCDRVRFGQGVALGVHM